MPAMSRLRAYHALLAVLMVAAYFSTEWGSAHAWLGYGVAAVIALRLVMALTGSRQLGLMRFYPHFQGLKVDNAFTHPAISRVLLVGIAVCLIGVTATGIAMDGGRSLGANPPVASSTDPSRAAGDAHDEAEEDDEGEEGEEGGPLGEVHELFGNGLMLLVVLHVSYLFLFKRPLARFMLFAAAKTKSQPLP
ncbi:cytochrome b/b6 domain-containing protein [Phenylobacterium sp.]|uniref:cytochrome b/b6 domain-containing protein n=1 Tax=Phenylobacterium sp. TaxID=1871053 RepID=UPI002737ABA4|nr:cytochrome b/b6 domain-containing protein [Phenylobacterium sp.]MDP3868412.1 cytochrome b/b6 domain-containing protein [Phenylobacterium sp.]